MLNNKKKITILEILIEVLNKLKVF